MTTDIWCLPDEVLEYIFSYMSVYEKLRIALVCKHWLKVLDSSLLLEDIVVRWSEKFVLIIPFNCSRRFSNFILSGINFDRNHLDFFIRYGDNIKELKLQNCDISFEIRKQFYRHKLCKNLSSLRFLYRFINVFSYLPSLKLFHIECCYEDQTNCVEWTKIIPNVEELSFHVDDWCFRAIIPYFLENRLNFINRLFRRNIISQPISLSFHRYGIPEKRISDLLEMRDHFQLKKVVLDGNDSEVISNLLKAHNHITDLFIHSGVEDEDNVRLICSLLPALKSLQLIGTPVDSSIIDIFRLKELQAFSTCGVGTIKKESFTNAFRVAEQYNLRTLKLSGFSFDTEELGKFLKKVPYLRCLHLIKCNGVSDDTVKLISKHVTGLRHLMLTGCQEITDAGIYSSQCVEECLSNIKGLRKLQLFWCENITSTGLLSAIKFRELWYLGVSGDNSIDVILQQQNPFLKTYTNLSL